ncbi:Fe2+-enterobactin ABC transporter substrate-binding protein [Pantoea vagans]|uniref:Fe2+-enterobactin ABC transporter substrate-binding protein n=1 Tax=Pantoea vagans TaxID=470934 RepID=UPI0023B129FC|nr:Fe2+-enterobactin ABC transporter substrate-binding protein [Pantoea vagans]MDE8556288.1 Fe2+-enterobactin ABC transporter substrate-binding protein [Pantoea vagans]MDE8576339.1 Fe2+-enterobactin ABC transporter substrate-binding protein [Pantoea vagans]
MTKQGATSALALLFLSITLFSVTAVAQTGWPRTLAGAKGQVTLTQAPTRIVSTSVTLTGSLLAIDAPVVASGATAPGSRLADEQGFFRQWGRVAKQRGVKRLYIGEPNAEAIAAEAPDLIVVSATGNDSAIKLADQLSAIAPVLVVNYDDKSWQQLVKLLGEATGHEADAAARISEFDAREKALKAKLTLPPQPVSAMVWNGDGRAVNLWTEASAQGKLLQELGFTLATPPATLQSAHSMGQRKDILQLSGENLAEGLNGQTYLLFAAEDNTAAQVMSNAFLAQTPAVRAKAVYALGLDSFRLDYYSASNLLTRLEALFVKS